MTSYTFSQLIDFTRTTSATYVNSAGLIATTPASVNLLTYTQEFDNAAWSKNNVTIAANSTTAPDGTLSADKLVETTAASTSHRTSQGVTTTASAYTYSVYLKAAERSFALLYTDAANVGVMVNLSTGATNSVAGVNSPTSSSVTDAGSGWLRCSMTFTATAAVNTAFVYLATNSTTYSYTGDGTSGIFIWGAQLELGSTATTYTRNYGGVYPPRFDYDPVTLAPKGLLIEEQRTNLFVRSSEFETGPWLLGAGATITANSTVSPDGTSNADTFVPTASGATATVVQIVTKAASSITYTTAFYAKAAGQTSLRAFLYGSTTADRGDATFNLANGTTSGVASVGGFTNTSATMTSAGNGWYRCTITTTSDTTTAIALAIRFDGTPSGSTGFYLWGAQLEAGAFATSYIPTVASQVTRAADVATIQAPMFASWFNNAEGTLLVEASAYAGTNVNRYYEFNDGTSSNLIQGFAGSATIHTCWVDVGGAAQARLSTSGSPTAATKFAAAYKLNDFAASLNGATPATDTSGTVPTVNRFAIGNNPNGNAALNGWVRSIRYYPTRLTNAQLQALTA